MIGAMLVLLLTASPLDSAREAFQSGNLAVAQGELVGLLYPLRLGSAELERDAHLLLSVTYFAQDDLGRAEEEGVLALGVLGEASLDPLVFPPDFAAFLDELRSRHRMRITSLATERQQPPAPADGPAVAGRAAQYRLAVRALWRRSVQERGAH